MGILKNKSRNMLQSFCKAVDIVVYIALTITGSFFIYHGEVWQRFTLKRTNFAVYDKPVTALPTILTYIEGDKSKDLKYGLDFNITLSLSTLKMGLNIITIGQQKMEVDFEALWDGSVFKISPIKSKRYIAIPSSFYYLEYVFGNTTGISKVSLQLTTATGGSLDRGFAYRDRDFFGLEADVFQTTVGSKTNLIVLSQNYKYLKSKGCKDYDSMNELQLQITREEMFTICERPCKPILNFGKKLNEIFDGLPDCHHGVS